MRSSSLVALAASLATSIGGCALHVIAPPATPDLIARVRAAHTVQLEREGPRDGASAELCDGQVCVSGLRDQIEDGLGQVLDAVAQRVPDTAPAQYIARVEDLRWTATGPRFGPYSLALAWRLHVSSTGSARAILDVRDTESTAGVPERDVRRRLEELEHAAIEHMRSAIERTELVAP